MINLLRCRFTDEDDGKHLPASDEGDAAAEHAVCRQPSPVELVQFQQRFIHIHLGLTLKLTDSRLLSQTSM